jgi:hypothetical protein
MSKIERIKFNPNEKRQIDIETKKDIYILIVFVVGVIFGTIFTHFGLWFGYPF